jgi:hypothetical protein
MPVTVSYKPISDDKKLWMVTYDGRILGDDRKYDTRDEARTAALKRVNDEPIIDGARSYIFRPY